MTYIPRLMGLELHIQRPRAPAQASEEIDKPQSVEDVVQDMDPFREVFPRTIKRVDKIGRY